MVEAQGVGEALVIAVADGLAEPEGDGRGVGEGVVLGLADAEAEAVALGVGTQLLGTGVGFKRV